MERKYFFKEFSIAECKSSLITLLSICRFLPTKNNRRMKEIDLEIRKILREIIGKREKATKNGKTNNDDLLGLLLESNTRQSNGNASLGLTTEDVIEECKLFYFAGMETTSVLLTWTLIVLSMHPEWQERAREEVLSHFGRTRPDFDSLSRLKTVSAKSMFYFIASQHCRLLKGYLISIPLSN
jgi:cytochrome P450